MLAVASGSLVLFALVGIPLVFALGAAAMLAVGVSSDLPLMLVPQRMMAMVDSFTLVAVPLFVLAGTIMEEGGISGRLVRFASTLVGHRVGGLAMVAVLSCLIFSGISGSSAADASAVGAVLIPAMIKRGYHPGFVAALLAASATMGPLIPPSTLAVIYGSLTDVSIGRLFLGGLVPGLLICVAMMGAARIYAGRLGYPVEPRATWGECLTELRRSYLALLVPVVILVGIGSGIFSATEAGAIAVLYAFVVAGFVYRELEPARVLPALRRAALTTSLVMIVISAAGAFAWLLASEDVPSKVRDLVLSISSNRTVAILVMLALMFLVGCVMEIVAAGIIMVPVLAPVAVSLGADPVHFAVLMIMVMALGAVHPPIGVTLFITVGLARTTLREVNRFIWPLVGILLAIILLCVFVPPLITFLPYFFFPPH